MILNIAHVQNNKKNNNHEFLRQFKNCYYILCLCKNDHIHQRRITYFNYCTYDDVFDCTGLQNVPTKLLICPRYRYRLCALCSSKQALKCSNNSTISFFPFYLSFSPISCDNVICYYIGFSTSFVFLPFLSVCNDCLKLLCNYYS